MTTTVDQKEQQARDHQRRFLNSDRSKPRIETRKDGDEEKQMIVGYAAVFYDADDPGTEFRLWSDTYERIMPGAFDEALKLDDVRGLANHEVTWLLGRTKSGTCRLSVDSIGLRYEIDVPDTQAGRDTITSIERGDLDGSSFSFDVWGTRGKVVWVTETRDDQTIDIREVHNLELFDVGPVTFPAYEATTSGMRDRDLAEVRSEHGRWRAKRDSTGDDDLEMDLAIAEAELQLRGCNSSETSNTSNGA